MRSECQFFMAPEDEAEFADHAKDIYGLALGENGHVSSLTCSLGAIQFLRSQSFGPILTAGRIALQTTSPDGEQLNPETAPGLERIYRALRRWLQKHYTNDLAAYNEIFPPEKRKVVRYASVWLGPHARHWLLKDPGAVLKHFHTDNVVFIIPSPSDVAGK